MRTGKVPFNIVVIAIAVAVVAGVAGAIAVVAVGPSSPVSGDGTYYVGIARALAQGKGFVSPESPWPAVPTTGRMPGWPLLIVPGAAMFPNAHPMAVLRWSAAAVHAIGAVALFLLALVVSRKTWAAALAGFAAALSPVSVSFVTGGFSEIASLAFAAGGIALLLRGGRAEWMGAAALGAASLVRSNLVILPLALVAVLLACGRGRHFLRDRRNVLRIAALSGVFWLLPAVWTIRNYAISGSAVFSSIEGETLYGANNPVVSNDLSQWGYWIMPDGIPGETSKRGLATQLTETELSSYYHRKAVSYARGHLSELPRLILGKLIRAFVPIPWAPLVASYIAFAFRALIQLATAATAALWLRRAIPRYQAFVAALFLLNLATVIIYYGCYRFTYATVEVFCLPLLAAAAAEFRGRSPEGPARHQW